VTPADVPRWQLLAESRAGTNHQRAGRPHQDWLAISPDYTAASGHAGADTVLLAVADGHGSAEHPHSDRGAKWATEAFLELATLLCKQSQEQPLPLVKALAEEDFPLRLTRYWRSRVRAETRPGQPAEDPPAASGPDDQAPDDQAPDDQAPEDRAPEDRDAEDVLVDYGSTLLGAMLTPRLLICWQLGDGDIVIVDGNTPSCPLTAGEGRLGVRTDSLCQPDAWQRMRVHWQPITGKPPSLVMLSTDGLSDSFADRAGFEEFAVEMLGRVRSEGAGSVQARLADWLDRASEFSGDDVTVAAACLLEG